MRVKLLLISLMLMFTGCEAQNTTNEIKSKTPTSKYVDFKRFSEGRPCSDVTFMCLPESQDKSWQSVPTKDKIEELELTAEVETKYKLAIKAWNNTYHTYMKKHPNATRREIMLITSLDRDFFEKVDERRFLEEMEQDLEKEFPGFWREVAKPVRYRWIRRAMSKAKKLGYKSTKSHAVIALCARIGLDFDLNPKWDYLVEYIKGEDAERAALGVIACDYIDYTIFGKLKGCSGVNITDWSMREAHPGLPYPKNPYPKLND